MAECAASCHQSIFGLKGPSNLIVFHEDILDPCSPAGPGQRQWLCVRRKETVKSERPRLLAPASHWGVRVSELAVVSGQFPSSGGTFKLRATREVAS
jgi:hypothetical protein